MRELTLAEPATQAPAETDASLAQEALRDPAAFAVLYRRYAGAVHRYLYSRTHNAADADDLTAEVFTEALKALPRYRERGQFAAWLFTIACRKAAGHVRRLRPQVALDEAALAPAASPDPLAESDPPGVSDEPGCRPGSPGRRSTGAAAAALCRRADLRRDR
jgi:DNA-directed RNA polymerase specialized sigma24 family protein